MASSLVWYFPITAAGHYSRLFRPLTPSCCHGNIITDTDCNSTKKKFQFACEFCEILQGSYLTVYFRACASELQKILCVINCFFKNMSILNILKIIRRTQKLYFIFFKNRKIKGKGKRIKTKTLSKDQNSPKKFARLTQN